MNYYLDVYLLFNLFPSGIPLLNLNMAKWLLKNRYENIKFFRQGKIVKKNIIESLVQNPDDAELRLVYRKSELIYEGSLDDELEKDKSIKIGLYPHFHKEEHKFNYEAMIVHDLTILLTPEYHSCPQEEAELFKKCCQKADLLACVSEATKQDLIDYLEIPADKAMVSYPTLTLETDVSKQELIQFKQKIVGDSQYILVLGTIEPRKNISIIFDFLEKHPEYLEKYKFLFIGGSGWKITFEELVENLKISPKLKENIIKITSFSNREKTSLIQEAEFLIFPSFYEGYGSPIAEALHLGTPVLTSISSSLPEVAEKLGFYCNPYSLESFKKAFFEIETQDKKTLRNKTKQTLLPAVIGKNDDFTKKIILKIEENIKKLY